MDDVAIIGAGISGLTLALFLKQKNFKVTVYEVKLPNTTAEGAIALQPNGLRSLETLGLGLVQRVQENGFPFQALTFRNVEHKFLDKYVCGGDEEFGHSAYRVYRQVFLNELKGLVDRAAIQVHYNHRFSCVVSEDEKTQSVVFAFDDGTQTSANFLIGADGIHSKVRQYILPDVTPNWSGTVAVTCITAASNINYPSEDYKQSLPVNIHGPSGAVHIAPQTVEGTEHLAAVQWMAEDRSRVGWKELNRDKTKLREVMKSLGSLNDITKTAIGSAPDESFTIWPVYTIPKLETWFSSAGRVLIVGDAAHASMSSFSCSPLSPRNVLIMLGNFQLLRPEGKVRIKDSRTCIRCLY